LFSSTPTHQSLPRYPLVRSRVLLLWAIFLNIQQQTFFTHIGESMTGKIRNKANTKILMIPITWFD
jgi:hypothetical protein